MLYKLLCEYMILWKCPMVLPAGQLLHAMLSTSVHPPGPLLSLRARLPSSTGPGLTWKKPKASRMWRLQRCCWNGNDLQDCWNIGVGCHFLPQGIFPTQGSNLHLLPGRWILKHWATREAGLYVTFVQIKEKYPLWADESQKSLPLGRHSCTGCKAESDWMKKNWVSSFGQRN